MVIRNVVKLLIATGEAVGKAFTRAVRDEIKGALLLHLVNVIIITLQLLDKQPNVTLPHHHLQSHNQTLEKRPKQMRDSASLCRSAQQSKAIHTYA